ncbi:MAG: type I-F CRISPR-associated helicase Cas3, partial [Flavobacteriales bacterium]|nr:type I-F CRISPR-associated helicase Cas3 [Flavobacteriales bacterium]
QGHQKMMVTFISQCEKKALNKTRRVLDAFANRIGDNAWQTVITNEGLLSVKKLLRKTASKNTAVSCHWIRSRSRSELVWVVGKRSKFNSDGIVPVNNTSKSIEIFLEKDQWKTIVVIKYASAIAGLFHDFGKANVLFQEKLKGMTASKGEPYRHEWISLRLFQSFTENKPDIQWLQELTEIEKNSIASCFRDGLDRSEDFNHPINKLSSFAQLVAWLILTHHKLPLVPTWKDTVNLAPSFDNTKTWLSDFEPIWNSYQCKDADKMCLLAKNWDFENKLPVLSMKWRSHACAITSEALTKLRPILQQQTNWLHEQLFTTHLARLSLMLADHYYSSQEPTEEWQSATYNVIANTDRKTRAQKQQLDEHLIGVAYSAKGIVKALPKLKSELPSLGENSFLKNNVEKEFKENFGWQNKARKLSEVIAKDAVKQGFFGINIASTGKGKTLANAKIMYALGNETGAVRFSVALGLRTLTLQTGKEFRKKLELNDQQLAIAVGGVSVKQLFENRQQTTKQLEQEESTGSASQNEIIDADLHMDYAADIQEHSLSTWTKQEKRLDQLIQAPILVSTIDHLISATEGTKGGRQIAPMLRLLTSDLVLDEPDDFGLDDLPALCRLVHWAAMLGSKVLLSTATMPPAMANALFQSYQAGWAEYAKANIEQWNGEILCAWFDEWESKSELCKHVDDTKTFQPAHENFIKKRIKNLKEKITAKQLGSIAEVENNESTVAKSMAIAIQTNIVNLHKIHCVNNEENESGKSISIGLVRMANINPLAAVAKELMALTLPDDICVHYCIYHSRYPLAIRSHIENNLDDILNRQKPDEAWEILSKTVNSHSQNHHAFVVLASPVAEVGRDHDYDWAIIEPSSMRSIIQIAGRVLRHRAITPTSANIVLLNKNYKALSGKPTCFNRPGFESDKLKLNNHELNKILIEEQYHKIDAIQRIKIPDGIKTKGGKYLNLNELEHKALTTQLFCGKKPAKVWWQEQPHWCGEVQRQQKFRQCKLDNAFYLFLQDDYSNIEWKWLNEDVYPSELGDNNSLVRIVEQTDNDITQAAGNHFWFDLRAKTIYEQLIDEFRKNGAEYDLTEISRRFGEVRLIEFNSTQQAEYNYHPCLGVYQDIGNR